MFLTETWLGKEEEVVAGELTPPGYSFINIPRGSSNHGGLGVIFRTVLKLKLVPSDFRCTTFEHALISDKQRKVIYALVYRPPPSTVNKLKTSDYLNDFDDFLIHVNSFSGKILLLGDFNIHVNTPSKPGVTRFMTSYESAGFCQHIKGPTHRCGNTLDLILSRPEDGLVKDTSVGTRLSDHNFILCTLNLDKPEDVKEIRSIRNLCNMDQQSLNKDLDHKFRIVKSEFLDINSVAAQYHSTITDALNTHAPISRKTCSTRVRQPWYNPDIHKARRERRRLERKWRTCKSEVHHDLYIAQNKVVNSMIDEAKVIHYKSKLESADTKSVFKLVKGLLNNNKKVLPDHTSAKQLSDDFANYFSEKVAKIHSDLKSEQSRMSNVHNVVDVSVDNTVSCHLSQYDLVDADDVANLISKSATKSSLLDPIPTWYIKQNISVFVPVIQCIINMSLSTGVFPDPLKQAIITPIIKKQSLDANVMKNYRPVANIPFISKLIEKHVFKCINTHTDKYSLGEEFQSAYRSLHSTETALTHVKNTIMQHLHNQQGVFLVLLDLSAAFDMVEHSVLVRRMANEIGLRGTALEWYKSYFTGRTNRVCISDTFSVPHHMDYGLPQGSIVGPGSFKTYIIPVGRIISKHNIYYHMYADDIQLFMNFNPSDPSSIQSSLTMLSNCITDIKLWMTNNMLKLNDTKTEFFIAISPHNRLKMPSNIQLKIGTEYVLPSDSVRNLGVIFDNQLSMSSYITSLCSSVTYHLRNITRIRRFLDRDSCHHVVRSLVLSRLDYANAVLLGANSTDILRLQRLQNWSAKLIFRANKRDHATPFIKELHWLTIKNRITFKILVMVYKCLNGLGPSYLATILSLYSPARTGLRSSSDTTRLTEHRILPRTLQSAADKSFSFVAPRLWNKLPASLRSSNSLQIFKKGLKTHLFTQ
jgi:hypothetical protein